MKQFRFTIKLYTFSDFKQWIWRKLFLPKRKEVEAWLCEYHDPQLANFISDLAYDTFCHEPATEEDSKQLSEFARTVRLAIKEQEKKTIQLIYK